MRSHRCQHPSASLRRAGSSLYQSRQTPLVPVLEHVDMPNTGDLRQDGVAAVRHQIRITAPFQQFLDTMQLVAGLTTPSLPDLFANTGQDRGPAGLSSNRPNV